MIYEHLIRPGLFCLPPETVHHHVTSLAKVLEHSPWARTTLRKLMAPSLNPRLHQTFWGMPFQFPVGLAAGFDKNIELIPFVRSLGFGFEEAGSVTAVASEGNPLPRLFRLPQDKAVINRMGLNNSGVGALASRIRALPQDWPVGLSIAKTHNPAILGEEALEDFATSLRGVHGYGAYVSLNISCPNTKEGKTFEDPEALDRLLYRLRQVESECVQETGRSPRPWCLKLSPDISVPQLKEVVEIGGRHNIAGWIAGNTSAHRYHLRTDSVLLAKIGHGGLSGAPLREPSTRLVSELYRLGQSQPSQVIMGVGGVSDVESAWEKIIHGASLVQLYTGLIYAGPGLPKRIAAGLLQKLDEAGLIHISQAVGLAHREPFVKR